MGMETRWRREQRTDAMISMTRMQLHFGSNDIESFNDIQTGLRGPAADATKIILITASDSRISQPNPSSPSVVVNEYDDQPCDCGPAIEATRAQVLQTQEQKQRKQRRKQTRATFALICFPEGVPELSERQEISGKI